MPLIFKNQKYISPQKAPAHPGRRGFTLVEILVGLGVLLIFLFFLFSVFIMGYNSWKRAEVKMEIDRDAALTFSNLARELRHSDELSVQILYYESLFPYKEDTANPPTSNCAVCFLSPFDRYGAFQSDAASGEPVWQAYIIYYLNTRDKTIRRQRVELSSIGETPSTTAKPIGSSLQSYLNGTGETEAHSVETFQVIDSSGNPTRSVTNPIQFSMYLEKISTRKNIPEKMEMKKIIRFYN